MDLSGLADAKNNKNELVKKEGRCTIPIRKVRNLPRRPVNSRFDTQNPGKNCIYFVSIQNKPYRQTSANNLTFTAFLQILRTHGAKNAMVQNAMVFKAHVASWS